MPADVITVTVDCGQHDNFNEIERKAQAIGAIKHVHIDAREEFASNFVVPSIKANGLYQGKYPLATALARPLIAAKAVEVANKEGVSAVAHAQVKATTKLGSTLQCVHLIQTLESSLQYADLNLTRDLEISFAREQNIPIASEAKKYSIDINLWGRAVEGGKIEDADFEPPEEAFEFINFQNERTGYMEIEFDQGVPML